MKADEVEGRRPEAREFGSRSAMASEARDISPAGEVLVDDTLDVLDSLIFRDVCRDLSRGWKNNHCNDYENFANLLYIWCTFLNLKCSHNSFT